MADPIEHAEGQMAKHVAELYRTLGERIGLKDMSSPLTDDEPAKLRAAMEKVLAEDPEARALAGRLAALQQFRDVGR